MAWRFHGKATVDTNRPSAWGVCDRCGGLYDLNRLQYQWQWASMDLVNLRIRVCPTCLDKPSPFLRTIIIPPDPVPAFDPRPEPYAFDEIDYRVTEDDEQRITETDLDRVLASTGSEDYGPPEYIVIASTAQMAWEGPETDLTYTFTFTTSTGTATWTGPVPSFEVDDDFLQWAADILAWGSDELSWGGS